MLQIYIITATYFFHPLCRGTSTKKMKLETGLWVSMTKNYSQFIPGHENQMEALTAAGPNQNSMTKAIGVFKSTHSRS